MDEFIKKYENQKDDLSRIRISFIGNVRYYEENIKLINIFSNDERFLLQYFGAGSDKLKEYCEKKGIKNVKFHGKFAASETINFYNNTDIINNVYGNQLIGLTTALSNKLYYSVCFKLPILVSSNTYMEKLSTQYNFGFIFQENKDFPDKLYQMYLEYINKNDNGQYEMLWKQIQEDEEKTKKILLEFLH